MSQPLVSVILPIHNGLPYLPAALQSVLSQDYPNLEIVAVCDGCTDGSDRYLSGIQDLRLRVTQHEHKGLGATLNAAISGAKGEYVARMDSDDIALPNRLSRQLQLLEQHRDVVMVGTQIDFLVGSRTQTAFRAPLEHRGIEARLLKGRAGVCHPTIMIRRSVLERLGCYRIEGVGEDIDFCLRACEQGRVANTTEVLYQYRLHRGSLGITKLAELQFGYAFATASAMCRRSGRPEPTLEEYRTRWAQRGPLRRLTDRVEAVSSRQYRLGRIEAAERRAFRAVGHLLLAGTLGFPRVIERALGAG